MEMGAIEQTIAMQAYRSGLPMPDRIANAPELRKGLELYYAAFFDLDSERSHAVGVTAIPRSKVKEYADDYDFDEEQREDLIYFIKAMDTDHCKRLREKK